jgi:hypothetical protein
MRNTANQDVIVHTNDTFALTVNFVDCNGGALDVTGASIVYSVYRNSFLPPIVTKTGGTDFTVYGSSIEIVLSPTNTVYSGNFRHKVVLTDGAGQVFTVVLGKITFTSDEMSDYCASLTAVIDDTIYTHSYIVDLSRASNSAYVLMLFYDEGLG